MPLETPANWEPARPPPHPPSQRVPKPHRSATRRRDPSTGEGTRLLRNKLGRTITGAAVLALTATGAITGTANASTDAADNASVDAADSTSIDLPDSISAAVPDAVWTASGWPAPSADPHLPDANGNIAADQEEEPQPLIDEGIY